MKFIRIQSMAIGAVFTVVSLFGARPSSEMSPNEERSARTVAFPYLGEIPPEHKEKDPDVSDTLPPEEAVALPQPYAPHVAEVIVPTVPDKKDQDRNTDRFLKGAFCALSALFFIAGYIIVKTNEGNTVAS